MLVWQEDDRVLVGYQDPTELAGRYDVADHRLALDRMAALLGELAAEAAG
jgi:hypothetical protein